MIYRPNTLFQIIMDHSMIILGSTIILAYVYSFYYDYFKIKRNTISGEELLNRYLMLRALGKLK